MNETDFEEFCFELLVEIGFVNVDWRKGTALPSSPADRGRDIVGQLERTDVDGSKHLETWFVDCKHYAKGVPPERLQGLLAWAHAERPHTALVIASGFLSNPAKDYLNDYELNNRPPFRIKYWERPVLDRLTCLPRDRWTSVDDPNGHVEHSASIVHRVLRELDLEADTVFWNLCPTHPAGSKPLSNRTPTADELRVGGEFLANLVSILEPALVVAVGVHASRALPDRPLIRHPANGGASAFRLGLISVLRRRYSVT